MMVMVVMIELVDVVVRCRTRLLALSHANGKEGKHVTRHANVRDERGEARTYEARLFGFRRRRGRHRDDLRGDGGLESGRRDCGGSGDFLRFLLGGSLIERGRQCFELVHDLRVVRVACGTK